MKIFEEGDKVLFKGKPYKITSRLSIDKYLIESGKYYTAAYAEDLELNT